jgi:citrate lyase subunit beta/citryl-CoA lyase
MAIHPTQLPIIHDVYTPNDVEIADALAVTAAAETARAKRDSIVITDDGRTVGPPMLANARNVLDLVSALGQEVR